jgi:hypothetical protein
MTVYWAGETRAATSQWPDAALIEDGVRLFDELSQPSFDDALLATDLSRRECSERVAGAMAHDIEQIETIAAGPSVKLRAVLRKIYGRGRWRKRKGIATVRLPNGNLRRVELHWYEAHGIGKRDVKIKTTGTNHETTDDDIRAVSQEHRQ